MKIYTSNARYQQILKALIHKSLDAADPGKAMKQASIRKNHHLYVNSVHYDLTQYQRIVCVGAGKSSAHMARTLEHILGRYLEGGLAIVKDGYRASCKKIQIVEGSHPIPDMRGVHATKQILKIVKTLSKRDLLIVLISGGASSLLCAPAPELTLTDKRRTTNLLLRCGADIQELNTVRKHLSAVKGGQLTQATSARILTLIVSDVLGDDLATIGSGPTMPDPTTFHEAKTILENYQLWTKVPEKIRKHLTLGCNGKIPETLKCRRQLSPQNQTVILGNHQTAIDGMAKEAKRLGLLPYILDSPLQGEAKNVGGILGAMAKDIHYFGNPIRPPACLIAGGEPTVTISGKGKGGRDQECMLAAAQEIAGLTNVVVAGFGTDGTDGPTDAAGAMVDGKTIQRARRKGLSTEKFLKRHDSYSFFNQVGGHIITGPTNTNVNDIFVILAL